MHIGNIIEFNKSYHKALPQHLWKLELSCNKSFSFHAVEDIELISTLQQNLYTADSQPEEPIRCQRSGHVIEHMKYIIDLLLCITLVIPKALDNKMNEIIVTVRVKGQ